MTEEVYLRVKRNRYDYREMFTWKTERKLDKTNNKGQRNK